MGLRSQLEKKIENKRQEIAELEAKLREANAFLQGLQEVLKMLPKEFTDEKDIEQTLRPGSNMAKARDYLRRVEKPKHISEILKGIGVEVNKSNRVSVSGSLGNYARKGVIFTHTGPNIFGLIEFGTAKSSEQEPPDDFGLDEERKPVSEQDIPF